MSDVQMYNGVQVTPAMIRSLLTTINDMKARYRDQDNNADQLARIRSIIGTYYPNLVRHNTPVTDLVISALNVGAVNIVQRQAIAPVHHEKTINYNYRYDYNSNVPPQASAPTPSAPPASPPPSRRPTNNYNVFDSGDVEMYPQDTSKVKLTDEEDMRLMAVARQLKYNMDATNLTSYVSVLQRIVLVHVDSSSFNEAISALDTVVDKIGTYEKTTNEYRVFEQCIRSLLGTDGDLNVLCQLARKYIGVLNTVNTALFQRNTIDADNILAELVSVMKYKKLYNELATLLFQEFNTTPNRPSYQGDIDTYHSDIRAFVMRTKTVIINSSNALANNPELLTLQQDLMMARRTNVDDMNKLRALKLENERLTTELMNAQQLFSNNQTLNATIQRLQDENSTLNNRLALDGSEARNGYNIDLQHQLTLAQEQIKSSNDVITRLQSQNRELLSTRQNANTEAGRDYTELKSKYDYAERQMEVNRLDNIELRSRNEELNTLLNTKTKKIQDLQAQLRVGTVTASVAPTVREKVAESLVDLPETTTFGDMPSASDNDDTLNEARALPITLPTRPRLESKKRPATPSLGYNTRSVKAALMADRSPTVNKPFSNLSSLESDEYDTNKLTTLDNLESDIELPNSVKLPKRRSKAQGALLNKLDPKYPYSRVEMDKDRIRSPKPTQELQNDDELLSLPSSLLNPNTS